MTVIAISKARKSNKLNNSDRIKTYYKLNMIVRVVVNSNWINNN